MDVAPIKQTTKLRAPPKTIVTKDRTISERLHYENYEEEMRGKNEDELINFITTKAEQRKRDLT
jgi:hypothetical protein